MRRPIRASVTVGIFAVAIATIPLIARHVDHSADEFSSSTIPIWPALGWLTLALLGAIAITREVQVMTAVDEGTVLAMTYDAMPLLLVSAWITAVAALLTGHWLLGGAAVVMCIYHVGLLAPRARAERKPGWVRHAPILRLASANVYVDNKTPQRHAAQLARLDADVLVLAEADDAYLALFDECGGAARFPHRLSDPSDDSDYAVTILGRQPFGPRSLVTCIGPLRLIVADVDVDGLSTSVLTLNPMSAVDPGGHVTWKEQIAILEEFLATLAGPVIVAGDLNTTRFRPDFEKLQALGLRDAIDSLGKGLSRSFKLSATGLLGALGALVRLDHALVNDRVCAVSFRNLRPHGSDHFPFLLNVAINKEPKPALAEQASV